MPVRTILYHIMPVGTIQYHIMPLETIQYHNMLVETLQYHTDPTSITLTPHRSHNRSVLKEPTAKSSPSGVQETAVMGYSWAELLYIRRPNVSHTCRRTLTHQTVSLTILHILSILIR